MISFGTYLITGFIFVLLFSICFYAWLHYSYVQAHRNGRQMNKAVYAFYNEELLLIDYHCYSKEFRLNPSFNFPIIPAIVAMIFLASFLWPLITSIAILYFIGKSILRNIVESLNKGKPK